MNLKDWLHRRELSRESLLAIAIELAEALSRLHARDLLHRDVSPWNVLIDAKGHATLIPPEPATSMAGLIGVPARVRAELSYIAPEETGRMNRLVDARADLYSLGAVLYELSTGRPPFASEDPVQLVHAHLARTPVAPAEVNPAVPGVLSDIVLRLLAKMPEARYQSARALLADLREAATRLRKHGLIDPFELGLVDLADELPLPARLYQRATEREALLGAWRMAAAGQSRIVALAGAAGVGKSALVAELDDAILRSHGRLVTAKFELQRKGAPYAPFAQAFAALVADLSRAPDAGALRQRLGRALGDNARLLADLSPELARFLDTPPPAAGASAPEARVHLAVEAFLRALAAPEHPLVLFFDDLQWADVASVRLLEALASAEISSLLIVVAFRPDECDAAHLVTKTLAQLAAAPSFTRVDLAPLDDEAVIALTSDALRTEPERARDLAALLRRKTAGNPFFLRRMLRYLQQAGLLVFDATARSWTWNLADIQKVDVSENVVDLLLVVLRRLPAPAQASMAIAACVGNDVPLAPLAGVGGLSLDDASRSLSAAVRAGLLVALAGEGGAPGSFRFAHDRIRQAAYLLLPEKARTQTHLELGRYLLREADNQQTLDERIYAIVGQLDHALGLVTAPTERLRFSQLYLRAARKARSSSAYGPALAYFECALALLPEDVWESNRSEAFTLHREALQLAGMAGDPRTDDLFQRALARAESRVEQADLYNIRMYAATARNAREEAFQFGLTGLQVLGIELPLGDPATAGALELAKVPTKLAGRAPADLLDAPRMQGAELLASMELLATISDATYFHRTELFPFVIARTVNLSLDHGNALSSAQAYGAYAVLLGLTTQDYATAHAFGRLSVDLAIRFGDPVKELKTLALFATCVNNWTAPLATTLPLTRRALTLALAAGDSYFASASSLTEVMIRLHQGAELGELVGLARAGVTLQRTARNRAGVGEHLVFLQAIRTLQGLPLQKEDLDAAGMVLDERGLPTGLTEDSGKQPEFQIVHLGVACLMRDFSRAHALASAVDGNLNRVPRFVQHVEYTFYAALTLAARMARVADDERAAALAALATHEAQLGVWAKHSPENYRHKHLLVTAERTRLEGKLLEAAELYDQAIAAAAREHFLQDEALAHELCARCYLAQGRRRIAALYFSEAIAGYTRWGAHVKAEALEAELVDLTGSADRRGGAIERGPTHDRSGGAALDLLALFRAAEAMSSEVALGRMLDKLMEVCLATAGAERGAFVLDEDGALFVRAVGAIAQQPSLQKTAVAESPDVPRAVIERAHASGETLVVGDACEHEELASDPYVAGHRVRSLFALPIVRQTKVMGVLYLENNLATRAFTPERVRLLMTLSSQIATSLQNSLLFERLNQEIEERKRLYREAQEAIRLRDEFLSIASHELNTPIASLKLVSQGFESADSLGPDPATFKKLTGIIARQSRRLATLVSDLLDVAQIPTGNFTLHPEAVELDSLVREVLELMRVDVDKARCPVSVTTEAGLIGHWDRVRLQQVVTNLLSNAIKFAAGTAIDITVAKTSPSTAALTVADHGIGIPPDRLPHIFGRFERAVSASHYGGLGLGLYVVSAIVDAHGGRVSATSVPGEGARFVVELPLAAAPSA